MLYVYSTEPTTFPFEVSKSFSIYSERLLYIPIVISRMFTL